MVLGISGSPRADSITSQAVKEVLSKIEDDTLFISLSGKKISGCISCLGCTEDNICILEDDFQPIAELMVKADAIVLGVPNYYNVPNALTHSLLERCFSFRHQSAFLMGDKPMVILSTGYSKDESNDQVLKIVEQFALKNNMYVVSKFLVNAYSQCFTCDFGRTCVDGNIVKLYGVVDEVTPDMLPLKFQQQEDSIIKCHNAATRLNDYHQRVFEQR